LRHPSGGGACSSTLNNCIVYFNTASQEANYDHTSGLNYCCTTPRPTNGVGNISSDPLFVDTNGWSDLRLQPDSPCINAGNNADAVGSTDLNGNPRISGGIIDMGAFEFVFTPAIEVGRLMALVQSVDLGAKNKQPLLATLFAAMSSLNHNDMTAALNQLSAFQHKVRAQVGSRDPALAGELVDAAQQIIIAGRESPF
jgi:hypothetical protein